MEAADAILAALAAGRFAEAAEALPFWLASVDERDFKHFLSKVPSSWRNFLPAD